MLELYHHNLSVCAQKVRLALAEKGLDWEDRHVDLMKSEHLTPEYLALNSKGVVPTLVHDGTRAVASARRPCRARAHARLDQMAR
ncbi:MAG: glutathione S-transferase N-terminal domain-containing protein [Alphaproteobacteria bacterium]